MRECRKTNDGIVDFVLGLVPQKMSAKETHRYRCNKRWRKYILKNEFFEKYILKNVFKRE